MPPIPIYAHSPINAAAKADGVTPQTAEDAHHTTPSKAPPPTTTSDKIRYPAAQPGAPAMPAPTATSTTQRQHYIPSPQPTRTQPLGYQGPPPPQPNAFPVPSFAAAANPPPAAATPTSTLPPPPKAGESAAATPTTTQQPAYYPPQMSIPAPPAAASQSAQRGTATTISFGQAPAAGGDHLDRYQRSQQEALERSELEERQRTARAPSIAEDGVWGSVKGAMAAAGEKIAAAEEEVWKRINKE